MRENGEILRSILYIFAQIISLSAIFMLLSDKIEQSDGEIIGVVILTLIFFIYAHKTIKILKNCDLNMKNANSLAI